MNSLRLLLLLSFLPTLSFAKFGLESRQFSLYWGQTYRIDDKSYHLFDLSYEYYNSACTRARFEGAGIRLDYFSTNNFALGIKYFKSFVRRPNDVLTPYWGIAPVVFQFNKKVGANLKPEIGIRYNPFYRTPVGVCLNVSYGYDIPIVGETNFKAGRHDLSARIALTVDLYDIARVFKRDSKGHDANPEEEKNNVR